MFKPIASGISPNLEKDDLLLALSKIIKLPFENNKQIFADLKKWFADYFFTKKVYLFNSGRSALYLLLKAAGIKKRG